MEWVLVIFFAGCFLFEIWMVIDDVRMQFDSKYRAKVFNSVKGLSDVSSTTAI